MPTTATRQFCSECLRQTASATCTPAVSVVIDYCDGDRRRFHYCADHVTEGRRFADRPLVGRMIRKTLIEAAG